MRKDGTWEAYTECTVEEGWGGCRNYEKEPSRRGWGSWMNKIRMDYEKPSERLRNLVHSRMRGPLTGLVPAAIQQLGLREIQLDITKTRCCPWARQLRNWRLTIFICLAVNPRQPQGLGDVQSLLIYVDFNMIYHNEQYPLLYCPVVLFYRFCLAMMPTEAKSS